MLALALSACGGGKPSACAAVAGAIPVTLTGRGVARVICAVVANTEQKQRRGLMFRTDLNPDEGMLFAPYPPGGGPAQEAGFWMKDTPSPLDILFIRPDRTITRIAENTVPFSEETIPSGEPVSAVLEIRGGRAAELGVAEGDKVEWTQPDPASAGDGAVDDGGEAR